MAKRKQITVYLNTKDFGGDDIAHTEVSTYKRSLADIYFLEDEDGKDFHYCIHWGNQAWDENMFEEELDAVRYVCREEGLCDKYGRIRLRLGYYANSDAGAITWRDDIENLNLVTL